jgi:predicted PurR-regulated permease PerM
MAVESADRSTVRRTMIVIGLVLASALVLFVVYETRRVLVWMLIAVFFAVALNPAVSWVERQARWCRRWMATLLVFVLVLVVLAGLVALFVVPLVREGTQLADQFPGWVSDVRAGRGPVGDLVNRFHLRQYVAEHSDQIRSYASRLTAPTLAFVRGTATTLAGLVTVIVLAYLMVLQAPKLVDTLLGFFDADVAQRIHRVARECARTITGYITGNLLISLICGGLTYAVLAILGVPFAGLIALFVGIVDLIPLVGATLGAIVAAVAGFVHSTTAGIVVIIFFIVYQQVENHLLQPLIFSRTVRLNPLTVLVAVLIAADLAGILGALLAIPAAGIIQIVSRDLWQNRRLRVESPVEPPAVG